MLRVLVLLLGCTSPVLAQVVTPPQLLGSIAGPGSVVEPAGVRFYGTDLGWTFEHRGRHLMLFGDTWPHPRSPCDPLPHNDDSQVTFPLELPASGLPLLTVTTDPDAPNEFARIRLFTDGQSQVMGYNKTPLTAFSDGTDAIALIGLIDAVRCRVRKGRPSCRPYDHLTCSPDVGICTPPTLGWDLPCDLATGAGCGVGEHCAPTATGICIDPDSSQNDGTSASLPAMAAYHTHLGIQDAARPSDYRDAGTIASNKFIDVTARTVRCFSGRACGNDYATGHGAVFIWGRPGYDVQPGRQAHMYLMVHRLPIKQNGAGALQLRPRYFAGVRAGSGEPLWTRHESRAKALAMDGVVDGNPDDDLPNPNQTGVSWLGPPVNKWMMLYGGGGSSVSGGTGPDATAGPIMVRFADHPWGPWSPPTVHLDPGSPTVVGDPFGPGGYIFHPACTDQPPAICAPSDPTRPLDFFLPGCPSVGANLDTGILYGPNIIDAYTRADGVGGLDVFWNVSVWNPYLVALLKTNVRPDAASAATACGSGGQAPRFRWCEKRE
ncbi:MAG TPA: hypothetical protein VGR62_07780 [Candidatus Binatia bacterium]|jgi:hypothetical protein|nr:hypothetical protein [Candidatus Binatia bacterium]